MNARGKIIMRASVSNEIQNFASFLQDYKGSGDGQKW